MINLTQRKVVDNYSWPSWSRNVASPSDPEVHCEAAISRLVDRIHPYIVDVKGLRSQFNAHNSVQIIEFKSAEDRQRYEKAWQAHLDRKAKIDMEAGREVSSGASRFAELASFTIFRCEAEDIRAEHIADFLHSCWQNGEAGVAALCFKKGISSVVKFLMTKHGYTRDDISLIWGGVARKQKVKKSKKDTMSSKELLAFSSMAEMSGMSTAEIDDLLGSIEETVEEEINQDIDPLLRLGAQTKQARQSEIDRFQSGKTKFCIFTFKSGGVGLSLHHCDELTTYKVKRKSSGYYEESDIANCREVRPRRCILTPTYSAIELVQGLGRCPRITSMSDTSQVIVFYSGTIEEKVAWTVSHKLKCLKKVVRQRESWEDIILKHSQDRPVTELPKLLEEGNRASDLDVESENEEDEDDIFGDNLDETEGE